MATGGSEDVNVVEQLERLRVRCASIPISYLNVSSRKRLSLFLNQENNQISQCGIVKDWQGVAQLREFDYLNIQDFKRHGDPCGKILENWISSEEDDNSIESLLTILENLERNDILEDEIFVSNLARDIAAYDNRKKRDAQRPVQVQEVSSAEPLPLDNPNNLTVGDVETGSTQMYDAILLYGEERSDFQLLHQMIHVLESPPYSLKLLVPDRDFLCGGQLYRVPARVINDRCKRLVIILTSSFIRSPMAEFCVSYAQAIDPVAHERRLLPCIFETTDTPDIIRHIIPIDFRRNEFEDWSWKRLAVSVKTAVHQPPQPRRSLDRLELSGRSFRGRNDFDA